MIPPPDPVLLQHGRVFRKDELTSTPFDQVPELLPIAKGFFDQFLRINRRQVTYVVTACNPGWQFASLSAYPGQGVGTWAPDGPSLPGFLDFLHNVLRRNRSINRVVLYVLTGFNDAVYAILAGQTRLKYLEGAWIDIHQAVSETVARAGIRSRVPLVIEKPLTRYDEAIQVWVNMMNEIADHLQETYGAYSLGIEPLPLADAIHPTPAGVKTIGATFARLTARWP